MVETVESAKIVGEFEMGTSPREWEVILKTIRKPQ